MGSLISHASLSLAIPIALLTVAVSESSSLAPLISAVGRAPLLTSGGLTARLTAVPLPSVATNTDSERCPALWRATDYHPENGRGLVNLVAHLDIIA